MEQSKLKYQLRVLISPSLWYRLSTKDKAYDEWMWRMMDGGELPTIQGSGETFEVDFAGLKVWIRNNPYADGTTSRKIGRGVFSPSRATALRFRDLVKDLLGPSHDDRFVPPPPHGPDEVSAP